MPASQRDSNKYSTTTGVIFLFNLIVGTGALALPSALQRSGILMGVVLLLLLGLFSLMTVTFVVEALADANALSRKRYENQRNDGGSQGAERTPLVPEQQNQESDVFEITEKYEIGQMGVLMTPKWSQVIIYFCLCVYLYGDIAIYEAVVGRTGTFLICTYQDNATKMDYTSTHAPCKENGSISRMNVYRIIITVFVLLLGPFVFFNLQKTKALQITTVIMRWLAFFIMIIWNIHRLVTLGPQGNPPVVDLKTTPTLFGTLVYSFMCQHSIPGLLQPISNKDHLQNIIILDYTLVACFYISLSLTAAFSFKNIEDIFTLNFWDLPSHSSLNFQMVLATYLVLFPIFTLSTSFPIISITLRNNLRALILKNTPPVWYYDRLLFPLLTILPPTVLALTVSDLHLLVGVVGSYAGACIQYMIPCLLVFFGRKQTRDISGTNKHASYFKHNVWIYCVYVWMVISLIFITINYIFTLQK